MELSRGAIVDGHYRLLQMLGRGGMGEVWEAEHTRLPRRVAVKFLLGMTHADPELLMRFRREAEIASRLRHPSIVQVTDFNVQEDGTAYLVMELLEGENLRARIARGALSLEEACAIARQIASALELAHAEGIVHRDLKPENVFLCREPDGQLRAKVLDFGISKLEDATVQATRDDRVLGTPGYMAPEQAMGKNSSIDGRTDLFALATIVYEMLTGEGVFVGETLAELCTKVLFHTPPPLDAVRPEVPKQLSAAVSRALSKEADDRQPTMRMFADALAARPAQGGGALAATALASVPPEGTRDSAARALGPSTRVPGRTRALAIGAGIGALVLLALVLALTRRSSAPEPYLPAPESTAARLTPEADEPAREQPPPLAREADASATPVAQAADAEQASEAGAKPAARAAPSGGRALPPTVASALTEAESALAEGEAERALRLARASLREVESERAYAVMARAYCVQRDVGMVQAMLRNLSPPARRKVQKDCQQRGLRLP